MERLITVVSTRNSKIIRITENAETLMAKVVSGDTTKEVELDDLLTSWGQVKRILIDTLSFDFDNLLATESVNKASLVNDLASLPEGDFKIFLRPIATKAGNDFSELSFRGLRGVVEDYGDSCKTFLNSVTSKNWTQLTKEELRQGLLDYLNSRTAVAATHSQIFTQQAQVEITETKIETVSRLLGEIQEEAEENGEYTEDLENAIESYNNYLADNDYDTTSSSDSNTLSQEDKDLLEEASAY
jgi:hypothetical protein